MRIYLRYPLSYQDVVDLLAKRGLKVDRSTVFRRVQTAKATLHGNEAIRTIKRGHIYKQQPGVRSESAFVRELFGVAP